MGAITVPPVTNPTDAERLRNATTTSDDTFAVSHALIVLFVLFSLAFALFALPWTFSRLQHAGWLVGFRLSSRPPAPVPTKNRVVPGKPHPETDISLPRRIGRLPLALPTYVIPYVKLSVPQAFLLATTTLVVFLASFVGSNVMTDSTRTGYVAITLVPCVIMLGNKVFGLGTILQVGYATINWFHRWLGRLLFLITTVHVIAYLTIFAQTHTMHSEMSKSSNILASISYSGFCLIFFASIDTVRRQWWHIFKVCHHFGVFLFIVGLNYHSKLLRPWVLYSVLIIFVATVSRILTSRLHIAYLTPLPSSKSTIIHLPSIRSGWIPGQHVRIRVLTGGMGLTQVWEGHPFTLSTAPQHGEGAKLVVKAAGDWTNRLFEIAEKKGRGDAELGAGHEKGRPYPVAVLIEGPYGGCNLVYSAYSSVLLVAGGSGVSYVLGVAQGMVADARLGKSRTRELNIIWSVRDRAAVNDLLPFFEQILDSSKSIPHFTVRINLYYTSVSRGFIVRPFSLFPSSAAFLSTTAPHPPSYGRSPLSGLASGPNSTTELLALDNNSSRVELEEGRQFIVGQLDEKAGMRVVNPFADPVRDSLPPPLPPKIGFESHGGNGCASPPVELKPGRPDYEVILKEIISRKRLILESFGEKLRMNLGMGGAGGLAGAGACGGGIAVGACGPAGLVLSMRKLCWDARSLGAMESIEFHDE
ncbi:uncharacterized protein EI90DRAFT_3117135 [Cantharellus anzutake]|uniref:uncharacterized protein n=1 Tax=Cantharellus anzutake TaxID=1750568 RepID=UPI0019047492|nr:uncharacterized protein EI90DRAFT_3117135 [Cantharellus anzutake]KAF8340632.1 hypothetical protein EI90DRAFT_3117135 [Cantharellus anzutake]